MTVPPLRPMVSQAPRRVLGVWGEFKSFLVTQNALALAIAVVIGAALDRVVKALVEGLIMPIVGAAMPAGGWEKWTLHAGPVAFQIGLVLSALVNFLIIGLVAWRLTKLFIKPATPDSSTKTCPYCRTSIDAAATRCAHCTSQLQVS